MSMHATCDSSKRMCSYTLWRQERTYSKNTYSCKCGFACNHALLLQSYKELCRQIGYDCNTDTVYAECETGAEGSAQNWPLVSLADATVCYDITSSNGSLQCVAYADSDGDT